jgi:hypothetical protein
MCCRFLHRTDTCSLGAIRRVQHSYAGVLRKQALVTMATPISKDHQHQALDAGSQLVAAFQASMPRMDGARHRHLPSTLLYSPTSCLDRSTCYCSISFCAFRLPALWLPAG